MNTVADLHQQVRRQFPSIAGLADRFHEKRWEGMVDEVGEYAWFEALADALNDEMRRQVPFDQHRAVFQMLARAYASGSDEVRGCIDVSFVENLFWTVSSAKSLPYWERLPPALKQLYVDFHRREP
ncbi:hypothetical protein ACG04R_02485 [Roseateles sp. BYS78W]|uniref:DUF7674 domain-containing protein n=1 Tax=Pelomonas candidula TaxID=3299025 RepID=A0ABW7H6Y6_9BURK